MKRTPYTSAAVSAFVIAILAIVLLSISPAGAASSTWLGLGDNGRWSTVANWTAVPNTNDAVVFTGNNRLQTTNNFDPGKTFSGITFQSPAGAFFLRGNVISLSGGITNNQALLTETVVLPIALTATPAINVASNASLLMSGVLSGAFGLTKVGGGDVNLAGANTFTGVMTVKQGSVTVNADNQLGAAPVSATPGKIVLDGGTLVIDSDFTMNANRGIAVGPSTGIGNGTIRTEINDDLIYRGIIANQGTNGGLVKSGFGSILLSSASTYSGTTKIGVGTVTLDFTQGASPAANVINSGSALRMGGENSGAGAESWSALTMNGRASAASAQTFSSTYFELGLARVRANSGASGSAIMSLGGLNHDTGGIATFVPPNATGGTGNITTTNQNINGILGGWAHWSRGVIDDGVLLSVSYASADGSGNIVPFTNFLAWTSGQLNDIATATDNLYFNITAPTTAVRVDDNNAGTTTDVNTIMFTNVQLGTTLVIGSNNVLRLGRFGTLFKNSPGSDQTLFVGGTNDILNTGSGNTGSGDVGTLTAGGAPNTAGEIVLMLNSSGPTAGSTIVMPTIADNGSGAVTVIKAGNATMKIDGNNTFSGGLIIHAGRVQLAGSEIGNPNPDGAGTGPLTILPGGQLFPSGATPGLITNTMNLAGIGFAGGNIGSGIIRLSAANQTLSGPMNLIGDIFISGGNTAAALAFKTNAGVSGKISGEFSFGVGQSGPGEGFNTRFVITNPDNDYSGNTVISSRTSGSPATLVLGANEVIPHGAGKGLLAFSPRGTGACALDLNGFNETINGFATVNTVAAGFPNAFVQNDGSGTSTLTVGTNDTSSTFTGVIRNNSGAGGTVALTKIGGGTLTLTNRSTYTGDTTINGGTLAISGTGAISNTVNIVVNTNARLDILEATAPTFSAPQVTLLGGALVGNTGNNLGAISTLNINNGFFTVTIDPTLTNVFVGTLNMDQTNRVNVSAVRNTTTYPTTYAIIKYNSQSGPFNFALGTTPGSSTAGYFINDTTNNRVLLILTNGPQTLTWVGNDGTNPTWWDINTTVNWLGFTGAAPFNTADEVLFKDTALTSIVNVRTNVEPSFMTVSNSTLNYTFFGSGAIGGFGNLIKDGANTLTFLNVGPDGFRDGLLVRAGTVTFGRDTAIGGGVTISNGATVRVGTNGGTGTFPAGNTLLAGSLIVNRGSDLTIDNAINGPSSGTIDKIDSGVLTLSGNNTYTAAVSVLTGTLRAGSDSALGATNGITVLSSGATLDVNGNSLGHEAVTVVGTGVGGAGAIINVGPDSTTAMQVVTLGGHSTFGGPNRWDIRQTVTGGALDASLNSGGQPYMLTKISDNQFSLVGVAVDAALGHIDVQAGTFSLERGSTLGNSASNITIRLGASFQLFSNTIPVAKQFILNGSGTNVTVTSQGLGSISGGISLTGSSLFTINNAELALNGAVTGAGSIVKTGPGRLVVGGASSYSGTTIVTNGLMVFNANKTSGSGITVATGAVLGGGGSGMSVTENVTVNAGGLAPGYPATFVQTALSLIINGNLVLNNSSNAFELGVNPFTVDANDLVQVNGDLTLVGTNTMRLIVLNYLTIGDTYTLFNYTGTPTLVDTNHIQLIPSFGYEYQLINPATTPGSVKILVSKALGFDQWTAAVNGNWDVSTTANWLKNGLGSVFTNTDIANFLESPTPSTTNVNIVGTVMPSGIFFTNFFLPYQLSGSGKISGSGGMYLAGGAPVYVENSGGNDFTGAITVDGNNPDGGGLMPQLWIGGAQLGGGPSGSLGGGNITNTAALIINRTGTINVSNNITGSGGITNTGTGLVILSGTSTFDGIVHIRTGVVMTATATALGSSNGFTIVDNGTTLDVNGSALAGEPVFVGGAGVAGQGAIVNSGVQQVGALRYVTLTADTTFGAGPGGPDGTNRWDIRGDGALLTVPPNSAYKITKIGDAQFSLVGITNIDPSLGDIEIQGGIFGIQTTTRQLGDPNATITVFSNATLNYWGLTGGPLNKKVVVRNGGIFWNENGTCTNIGNITLQGVSTFNIGGTMLVVDSPSISGTGSVVKIGGSPLRLSGVNSYTGNTVISNGSIALVGSTALTNSPIILFDSTNNNPAIDVSLRTDSTLTLRSGQLLKGSGSVRGSLVVSSGATVTPGQSIGFLTITNAATFNGGSATIMEINGTTVTNDQIRTTTVNYGGTLTVNNLGGTPSAGQSFRLFASSNYNSTFSSVSLPPLGNTVLLYWTNTLATDGRITVVSRPQPRIQNAVTFDGSTLTVDGFTTNGTLSGNYYVLKSTNVALPISQWTPIQTNAFGGGGTFNFTTPISTNYLFYIIQLP